MRLSINLNIPLGTKENENDDLCVHQTYFLSSELFSHQVFPVGIKVEDFHISTSLCPRYVPGCMLVHQLELCSYISFFFSSFRLFDEGYPLLFSVSGQPLTLLSIGW